MQMTTHYVFFATAGINVFIVISLAIGIIYFCYDGPVQRFGTMGVSPLIPAVVGAPLPGLQGFCFSLFLPAALPNSHCTLLSDGGRPFVFLFCSRGLVASSSLVAARGRWTARPVE